MESRKHRMDFVDLFPDFMSPRPAFFILRQYAHCTSTVKPNPCPQFVISVKLS